MPDNVNTTESNPNGAGRPTLYTPELIAKAWHYSKNWASLGTEHEPEFIPTIEGLCLYLGIGKTTCYKWLEEPGKEEFVDITREILDKQAKVLLNKGLSGTFNSTITKVILGKHGYSEKVDHDLTTKGESINGLPPEDKAKLDKILNGNQEATTEQGSPEGNDPGEAGRAEVPGK